MSGAPSGPGTARSCTEKAPPRARSSSVGAGMAGFGCRSSGIISGVNDGGRNSAKTERAAASSGSNGTGDVVVPEVDDVVTGSPRVLGVTAILGGDRPGGEAPGGGFGPPPGGSGRSAHGAVAARRDASAYRGASLASSGGSSPGWTTASVRVARVSATYRSLQPRTPSSTIPAGSTTSTASNSRPFALSGGRTTGPPVRSAWPSTDVAGSRAATAADTAARRLGG